MKFEFREDDVVVEIMDPEGFRYVIHPVEIDEDGYFLDSIVNGVRCDTCFWRSWDEAHAGLVKVGVWNGTREVDDEED